jgi:WD repeat-containing protein 40A
MSPLTKLGSKRTIENWSYPPYKLTNNDEKDNSISIQDYIRSRELFSVSRTSRIGQHSNNLTQYQHNNSFVSKIPAPMVKKLFNWISADSSSCETLLSTYNMNEKASSWDSQLILDVRTPKYDILHVVEIQRASVNPQDVFAGFIMRRNPQVFREKSYKTAGLDKIFTSAWLSDFEVVMGTKCNKVVVMNIKTGQQTILPSSIDESPSTFDIQNANTANFIAPIDIITNNPLQHCSGIHSIAINESKTLLAVGYGKSSEVIKVYSLPGFEPLALLKGHSDMVFSLHWLQDTILVSGSRDKSVKLWRLPEIHLVQPGIATYFSSASRVEHRDKVRDLIIDKETSFVYSLGADGFVKIWDCKRSLGENITVVPLIHANETVCMAIDPTHHIVSVGSQCHISLVDPRVGSVVHAFESVDEGWGVRSMCISNSLITIGGGLGRISFYDLRKMAYMDWDSNVRSTDNQMQEVRGQTFSNVPISEYKRSWLESGKGWLSRDPIYMNHFQGTDIKNAIYTLSYDSSGTRMFAAGGPLQLNLKGSYAGIWG